MKNENQIRYKKGIVSSFNVNFVEVHNPNVTMWWAAALPGYGHVLLGKYLKGFLLIVWEFVVNIQANLNTAIYFTFIGDFTKATDVLDTRWILLYVPVYLYNIWDCRRVTIDLNKYSLLADMSWSSSKINPITFSAFENTYLDKRKPWLAAFWSLITPGLGQLYINRLSFGFYLMVWFMVSLYFSNCLQAIHYTSLGDFQMAAQVANPKWLLFIPSMYSFAVYSAYVQCHSLNNIMKKQQSYYLLSEYQQDSFKSKLTLFSKRVDKMNIVASFDHSVYLELALKELEKNGIAKDDIFAVPLTEKIKPRKNSDIIRGAGFSLLDGTFAWGTVFSLFGVIYGFVLEGGPVIWGLIGLFFGWGFGFLIDLWMRKKEYKLKKLKGEGGEVMLIVHCPPDQITKVKEILFDHYTLGLQVIEDDFKECVF